ncbi:hypothetical protein ACQ7B2_28045, partial [Escherichia coli]
VTGLALGNFEAGTAKSKKDDDGKLIESVALGGLNGDGVEEALQQALVLAEATNQVRSWVTLPSNQLTPTLLAESAQKLYAGTGLEVE